MLLDEFKLDENDYNMIPLNGYPTKFYSITFYGFTNFTIDSNNATFNTIVKLASKTIKAFIKLHKDNHAFTQPQISFKTDGMFIVKIGTMENEIFEKLYKQTYAE